MHDSIKCIEIAYVDTEVIGGPYQYGDDIEYKYKIDMNREGELYTLRKNGHWQAKGISLGSRVGIARIGSMEKYYDPQF